MCAWKKKFGAVRHRRDPRALNSYTDARTRQIGERGKFQKKRHCICVRVHKF